MNKHGFTLIELLVVVLIIGILAAIALPMYQRAVFKSRTAEAVGLMHSLDKAHNICAIEKTDCSVTDFVVDVPGEWGEDCLEDNLCFKTKYWEYGSDNAAVYAYPIEGGTTNGNLMLEMNFGADGVITCSDNRGESSGTSYENYCSMLDL